MKKQKNKFLMECPIHIFFILLPCLFYFGCSSQGKNEDDFPKELSKEEIWNKFVSLPAPKEVQKDIDSLFSENLKNEIAKTIAQSRYFQVSFKLQDSIIIDANARYRPADLSKVVCKKIGKALIGHKPQYEFIKDYKYGSYDFVLDKKMFK